MKTICIMDSVSRANGGIFEAERRLQQSLQVQEGVEVQVVGLRDSHTESDRAKWQPVNLIVHTVRGPQAFGYAPAFFDTLLKADTDLAYCVGLWKYASLAALRWSRRTGKPMVVAPHGMLDPWALRNSRFNKLIAGQLFQKAQLQHAACIRALCESEARSIRAYGLKNPIAIIPNGIDVPTINRQQSAVSGQQTEGGRLEAEERRSNIEWKQGHKVLLYLGRIHPKKGLANLLRAWAVVNHKSEIGNRKSVEWVLAIAGWDQGGHEKELRMLSAECGIQNSVVFLGPKFGDEKAACYRNCDAFILPSFSEGLPMVILEAWAHGKPVLMTPDCNLPEGFAANAAICIEPRAESIGRGLQDLLRAPCSMLHALGDNGRALVAEKFAWPKIAVGMKSVYEWVLGGGSKPDCVILSK